MVTAKNGNEIPNIRKRLGLLKIHMIDVSQQTAVSIFFFFFLATIRCLYRLNFFHNFSSLYY